jgi:hypothetical protein
METRNKRKNNEPLPGDRQGMSGADAGHCSVRPIGDGGLIERAPIELQATAQEQHPVAEIQGALTSNAHPSTSLSTQMSNTTEDGTRTRIKWPRDMNIDVIKAFYRANKCEDLPQPGLRHLLHEEFKKIRPLLIISEQNVVDRKNVIIKKGYLTPTEIQDIRRLVENEIHQINTTEEEHPAEYNNNQSSNEPQENCELINIFYSLLEFYRNTVPTNRPKIPILKNAWKSKNTINSLNNILNRHLTLQQDLDEIQLSIFCAAITVIELNGQKPFYPKNRPQERKIDRKPAWQFRLEKSIDLFRSKVSIIEEYLKGSRSKKVKKKISIICAHGNIDINSKDSAQKLLELMDDSRQKAKMKGARLKRYNELTKRKHQNRDFKINRRKFFRNLETGSQNSDDKELDETTAFKDHWQGIWSVPKEINEDAEWIKEIRKECSKITPMVSNDFTEEDVAQAIKKTSNWKAPGPDGLQNFWLKSFTATHKPLAKIFSTMLNNPQRIPKYLTDVVTYLLYKKGNVSHPGNYRPITCLPVLYKLFTSLIYNALYKHCFNNKILAEEQKGCVRNALGCKHQLTIDAVVLKQAQIKQRNLHMAYIDYSKAFDSVPHKWLLKVLEVYKVCPKIQNTLNILMTTWKTKLMLNGRDLGDINILRGIFQGDSLSPLWFCLALNPMSSLLNGTQCGYKIDKNGHKKLNHLLFMDDLKLYSESREKLRSLIKTVEIFSKDISMTFGLDKCAIVSIRRGMTENQEETFLGIEELEEHAVYKYLGLSQNARIDHTKLKNEFATKYKARLNKIFNTKLSGYAMIETINTWAIPILTYSFGIVKWSETDLDNLDRKTRTLLTKFRFLHPNSSVIRLYLPRKEGGRGLLNIKQMCRIQEQNMRVKLKTTQEDIMKMVVQEDAGFTPLNLKDVI